MIGFGSIGRGTLPLIERHFKFDKSRMVGHRPARRRQASCSTSAASPSSRRRVTSEELQEAADAAADRGRRPGLLRQPVGRHLLARPDEALPQARRALRRHGRRAVARLLFRRQGRQCRARTNYALRETVRAEKREEPGRHDRGLLLRRQSRHGVVVRQAGAGQPRRRPRPRVQGAGADDREGWAQADEEGSASRASTSPSATRSAPRSRSR